MPAPATSSETPPPTDSAEPVAIIGLGCRLPAGIDSPDSYWDALINGRNTTSDVPEQRWAFYEGFGGDYVAALRRAIKQGSFLDDIEHFDAEFFGLSPREAELMDPQHRILLEVTWEALEHAGLPPDSLAGSDTGVFVSIDSDDYGRRLLEDLPGIEAWTGIGAAMCAAANRISYALDLRGASVAVDTACSGSLVTVHLACQSLRLRENDVALAAGINVLLSPGLTLTLGDSGALAPDGRCKTFDAGADGYGRGEGCAVLVLKRLADARRDGDRILAVIRGSAVHQDGRTSGIMAPNSEAQEHVIRRACRTAGLAPEAIDYVETHGTGTTLGDQLEARALTNVYGAGRQPDQPCLIGSVKPNIGHLEAAAGAASLIKAVLAVTNKRIPPSIGVNTINPAVDWDKAGLRVVTEPTAWPERTTPRRAGVSAFGFGGTIAHVVIEQAPETADDPPPATPGGESQARLYPLSARSEAALRQYAGGLADWLSGGGAAAPVESVGHTLALRRSHLNHRAAVVANGREDLAAKLRLLAAGEPASELATGSVPADPGTGLVFVFSGHGSHWVGMGRELLAAEPAFASVIDRLDPVFVAEMGFSPRRVLLDGELDDVARIQAMTYAMQTGLAAVWRSYGVTPAAVIGHSLGEFAASVAAGGFSLEEAGRMATRRARLLRRVQGKGAMVMANLPFGEVVERLSGRTDLVAAIEAAPRYTVVSGDAPAVEELIARWRDEGVDMRQVKTDLAFHSSHMDPLMAETVAAAADLDPTAPRIPMYTTSLPDPRCQPVVDGDFWAANLRNPVRLLGAVTAAIEDGYRTFLEVSPHPLVTHSVREIFAEHETGGEEEGEGRYIGWTLRRNSPERGTLLASAGALHCRGVAVDWAALQPEGDLTALPQVPWQRRPYWRDSSRGGGGGGLAHDVDSHALLGSPVSVAGSPTLIWRTRLSDASRPYPGSHAINGVEIVPAAVVLNTFLAAAGRDATLTDVSLRVPLTVTTNREVQVVHDDAVLRLASRTGDGGAGAEQAAPWVTHTTAAVRYDGPATAPPTTLAGAAPAGTEPAEPSVIRDRLAAVGVPEMAFDWTVEELWHGTGALRARIRIEQPEQAPPTWAPVFDAALSAVQAAYPGDPVLRMVAGIGEVTALGPPPETILTEVLLDGDRHDTVHVTVATPDGRVVARVAGVRCPVMGEGAATPVSPADLVHEVVWKPFELPAGTAPPTGVVVVAPGGADPLGAALAAAGVSCQVVGDLDELDQLPAADVLLLPVPAGPDIPVPEAAARTAWLLTRTAQRLAAAEPAGARRLWCVTTGVRDGGGESAVPQAAMWGLGRVIAGENPEIWGGLIDLAPGAPAAVGESLSRVLRAAPREDVIALDGTGAAVARMARNEREPVHEPVRCAADGTYLVTGGLGVLGLQVAHWLAERGARRLVLAGRRPFPSRASWDEPADEVTRRQIDAIRGLEKLGVAVRVVSLDIADAEQAARLLTPDALGFPPIRGVVHLAGVLDARMATRLDEESLRQVMRPKADGAWVLHNLFPPGSLDFFVLFSSIGQLVQMPGQGSYGAANAFLDALAVLRGDTTSFAWTQWRGQGMAVGDLTDESRLERGVSDITASEAFGAWDFTVRRGPGVVVVFAVLPVPAGRQRLPLLSDLSVPEADSAAANDQESTEPFAGLPPEELRERVFEFVGGQIAAEMKLPLTDLNPRRSLIEQGLDSVMTMVIRRRLEKRFGHQLPATLLWHRPTVSAITEHVVGLLSTEDSAAVEVGAE
ncbi:type I polyketide synthase [Phytohabitans suffuscus]|uniref:Phthiocerol synthesis polyketide synthase type I PpsA n=1 Tax=Phytohabitans suffuscus TaxID=624315 RepID=A0A6F8Y9H5_9ACTN|nr:type I polyketide synthase [Phytohabitans suffuscus]BCB82756.1 phthiocerol synthesis polyketide synthase type I PpsA [Phytohabitans suffuscus]